MSDDDESEMYKMKRCVLSSKELRNFLRTFLPRFFFFLNVSEEIECDVGVHNGVNTTSREFHVQNK